MLNLNKNSFIIDCNVVIKWFLLEEDNREYAYSFLERSRKNEIILYSPSIIMIEFANVLLKYFRLNILNKADCIEHYLYFTTLCEDKILNLMSLSDFVQEIITLGLKYKLSYYDAEYLYLSNQLNCKLITFDKQLAKVSKLV